jgi:hypothetical protein
VTGVEVTGPFENDSHRGLGRGREGNSWYNLRAPQQRLLTQQ